MSLVKELVRDRVPAQVHGVGVYPEKKQDAFLRGLDPELRTLIGVGVYLDFNTMVNRAITTAKNKQDETRDRKRKFEAKRAYP
jgi:hypothetical protein